MLAESRKYRLSLTLVHQYLDQLDEEIGKAVFGNVGTLVAFRVGNADAELLAREFHPHFSAEDLISLERYRICLRLMIDGEASKPFSAVSLPPMRREHVGKSDRIRQRSRQKYARPRWVVEDKIERWLRA